MPASSAHRSIPCHASLLDRVILMARTWTKARAYRRLPEEIAGHAETVKVLHTLRPMLRRWPEPMRAINFRD